MTNGCWDGVDIEQTQDSTVGRWDIEQTQDSTFGRWDIEQTQDFTVGRWDIEQTQDSTVGLKFASPYIFATWWCICKPLIFELKLFDHKEFTV